MGATAPRGEPGGEGGSEWFTRVPDGMRSLPRVLEITIGSALAGAATASLAEYLLIARHADIGSAGERLGVLALLSVLYGVAALGIGAVEGAIVLVLVASGAAATGRAFALRLSRDERFDREVAAALMAGGLAACAFAWWVSRLSFALVASTQRQLVGSILCGAVAAASLPLFVVVAIVLRRVTRPVARVLPRIRRLPATAVLGIGATAALVVAGAIFVEASLDWRAIRLGAAVGAVLFLGFQSIWAWLFAGALSRVRLPVRARRALLAVAVVAALVAPAVTLRSTTRPVAMARIEEGSYGGGTLAALVRRIVDRDRDGFSAVLGGGDCDDHDASVHPGAHDVPDDGIDQNCLGGDAHAAPPPPPPAQVPGGFSFHGNVLFVFIDALRADRLDAERMPSLLALANRGARFTRAYAQAPSTPHSYPSLVTSRMPSRVAWDDVRQQYPGMRQNRTVFEALRGAGYHTVAIASHFYFNVSGVPFGFDEFDNSDALSAGDGWEDVASPRILARVERSLPRLAASGQPFAMLVHFFEPHAAYKEHPETRRGRAPRTAEERYDEEVTYLDGQLGKLFGLLAENHIEDRTMVVVFADHGEGFGLHRQEGQSLLYHAHALYDEVLRVPLVISAPGLSPRVVERPVMLLDVAPTVLDVLGVALPSAFQGRSLAGALAGLPLAPAPVYAELLPRPEWPFDGRMLLDADARTKVIYHTTSARWEVYDLQSDPQELHDLVERDPAVAERMRAEMGEWLDSAP